VTCTRARRKVLTDARLQPHTIPLSRQGTGGALHGISALSRPARGWPARSGPARLDHFCDTGCGPPSSVALLRGDFVVELLDTGGNPDIPPTSFASPREADTERFVVGFLLPAATASFASTFMGLESCAQRDAGLQEVSLAASGGMPARSMRSCVVRTSACRAEEVARRRDGDDPVFREAVLQRIFRRASPLSSSGTTPSEKQRVEELAVICLPPPPPWGRP